MTSSEDRAAARWEPPALAQVTNAPAAGRPPAADEDLEQLRQQARDAGFAEGVAAGRAQMEAAASELSSLLEALAHPFQNTDAALLRTLLELVERAVTAILQGEFESPANLEAVLRDALSVLDDAAADIELQLNPADVPLFEAVALPANIRLQADAGVARGGLLLRSGASSVDATVSARLDAVMASLRDHAGVPSSGGDADTEAPDASDGGQPPEGGEGTAA
jgi:flagellar assembly protein FliH